MWKKSGGRPLTSVKNKVNTEGNSFKQYVCDCEEALLNGTRKKNSSPR